MKLRLTYSEIERLIHQCFSQNISCQALSRDTLRISAHIALLPQTLDVRYIGFDHGTLGIQVQGMISVLLGPVVLYLKHRLGNNVITRGHQGQIFINLGSIPSLQGKINSLTVNNVDFSPTHVDADFNYSL